MIKRTCERICDMKGIKVCTIKFQGFKSRQSFNFRNLCDVIETYLQVCLSASIQLLSVYLCSPRYSSLLLGPETLDHLKNKKRIFKFPSADAGFEPRTFQFGVKAMTIGLQIIVVSLS